MIEIAFDEHPDNIFLKQERPVFNISDFTGKNLDDYRRLARNFVVRYADEPIVIVHCNVPDFSLNMFALALFIESCHVENRIDCAVFKVADAAKATEAYKPYVALTIAIKYIMRLCRESTKNIYKEITGLGYLGVEVKTDYAAAKINIRLSGEGAPVTLAASDINDILAAAGALKALALMKSGATVSAEINMADNLPPADEEKVIAGIMSLTAPWVP